MNNIFKHARFQIIGFFLYLQYPYLGTLRGEQDDAWGRMVFLSPTRQLISPQPPAVRYFGTEVAEFHDGETTGLLVLHKPLSFLEHRCYQGPE